jgi:hypothetical protein
VKTLLNPHEQASTPGRGSYQLDDDFSIIEARFDQNDTTAP